MAATKIPWADTMRLPTGHTCSDCGYWGFCIWYLSYKGDESSCDWAPSRFYQRPEVHRG